MIAPAGLDAGLARRIRGAPMPTLVLPFPAINPVLVQWGPLAIRWYALAYIAGLVLGWLLIRRVVAERPLLGRREAAEPPTSIDDLLVYCAFGVIIGGRLGNVLFYDPHYYLAHPLDIFKVWEGGMAFHGGLIGAFIGMLLFARRYRDAGADRARSLLARRADRPVLRPDRQFHPPGAVGPADRRALGGGLPGNRRPAAPSEPDLRGAARRGCSPSSILFALARRRRAASGRA